MDATGCETRAVARPAGSAKGSAGGVAARQAEHGGIPWWHDGRTRWRRRRLGRVRRPHRGHHALNSSERVPLFPLAEARIEVAKFRPADAVEREAWFARHAQRGERDPYAVASARFAPYAVELLTRYGTPWPDGSADGFRPYVAGHDDAIAAQLKRELDDHGGDGSVQENRRTARESPWTSGPASACASPSVRRLRGGTRATQRRPKRCPEPRQSAVEVQHLLQRS